MKEKAERLESFSREEQAPGAGERILAQLLLLGIGAVIFRLAWIAGDIPERGVPGLPGLLRDPDFSLELTLVAMALCLWSGARKQLDELAEGFGRAGCYWFLVAADKPWTGGCLLDGGGPIYFFLLPFAIHHAVLTGLRIVDQLTRGRPGVSPARILLTTAVLGSAVLALSLACGVGRPRHAYNAFHQAAFLYGTLSAVLIMARRS